MGRWAAHRIDLGLLTLAALSWSFTLAYPFGWDHGLFDVVGREWFLHGALPYRDVVEHRPPVMHAVHGALALALGPTTWACRAFDLALTLATGAALAASTVAREESPPPGLVGLGALLVSSMYYATFGFWYTAQIDWTAACCVALGFWAARRLASLRRALWAGGLFTGLGVLTKSPVVLMALASLPALWWRLRDGAPHARDALQRAVPWTLGFLLPFGTTALYFALRGGLQDLLFWNVDVNAYYAVHERSSDSLPEALTEVLDSLGRLQPFSLVALAAVAGRRWWAGDGGDVRRVLVVAALMTLAALLGYAGQMKFYRYHAAPVVLGVALAVLALVAQWQRRAVDVGWRPERVADIATVATLVGVMLGPPGGVPVARLWHAAVRRWSGELDARWHARHFDLPRMGFSAEDSVLVGEFLRARARPGDRLSVRGFETQLYQLSGLRPATRFFWTNFITDPRRSLRREEWLAEEDRALRERPPRFVVTLGETGELLGSAWHRERAPYVEVYRSGSLHVLELTPDRDGGSR